MKTYDLTAAAEEDPRNIWCFTCDTWGADQADRYFERIAACLDAVGEGHARSKSFDELPNDVRMLR
ncbi:MAG: type II toxin-antitoxin system RelE/ParE family toxin, partial [Erythrobacter sp.]|nr:type II toxin-antitoxin system RelE/ParE family toxin [Erythrobacter sp.]